MHTTDRFDEKLARIFEATQVKGDTALAHILGIKPPSVAAARKRRQIPTGWVEGIAERHKISADWLFFGRGPMRCQEEAAAPEQSEATTAAVAVSAAASLSAAVPCVHCAKLEKKLESVEGERRELTAECREITAENRKLWKDNADLREENATLRARQYQRSGHGDGEPRAISL